MLQTAQHLEAADHALRTVCQSLLVVAAEDPSIYAVIQNLAEMPGDCGEEAGGTERGGGG